MQELKQDFDSKKIKSLCISRGPSHLVHCCFKSALPLDEICVKYDIMARHHQNDLFHRIWEHTSTTAAAKNPELTIEDIVTKLWKPTFEECMRILDSLVDCSMKLYKVDVWFRCYGDGDTIKGHLWQLHRGVELCHDQPPPDDCPYWIDNAVERMQLYWTLSDYAKTAKTVLDLRNMLELTGDFSLMEAIAKKVNVVTLIVFWHFLITVYFLIHRYPQA